METELKSERIAARITPEQKTLIAQAAAMRGRSLSDFLVESAQRAAETALEGSRIIRMSAEYQRRFAEALANPPQPNSALKASARSYDEADITSR